MSISDLTERKSWIDTSKGIGILFVIIGHTPCPFIKYIYGFHMPLLFIIAGLLYNREKWNKRGFASLFFRNLKLTLFHILYLPL